MTVRGLRVTVAYADPGAEAMVEIEAPAGTTVAEAVARSGLVLRLALDDRAIVFAIHGQRARGDTPLADGDRVELTRALVADPKETRHARAKARTRRAAR